MYIYLLENFLSGSGLLIGAKRVGKSPYVGQYSYRRVVSGWVERQIEWISVAPFALRIKI